MESRGSQYNDAVTRAVSTVASGPIIVHHSCEGGGYRGISGLEPSQRPSNSITLFVVVAADAKTIPPASRTALADIIARVTQKFAQDHMPGAATGANLYDANVLTPTAISGTAAVPGAVEASKGAESVAASTDVYLWRITVGQLCGIAMSKRNGGEDVIDTYYGWRHDRAMAVAKGVGAAVASILAAWLIPLLKNEYEGTSSWFVFGPPLAVMLALSGWALVSMRRLDRIHQSYVVSAALLQELRRS
jgi:hypothetical protein